MKQHKWPDSDTQTVNCPNCSQSTEVDLALVKELSLPLRPAECIYCNAEYELNHDGTTKLTFAHPKQRDLGADEAIKKIKNMIFDPL